MYAKVEDGKVTQLRRHAPASGRTEDGRRWSGPADDETLIASGWYPTMEVTPEHDEDLYQLGGITNEVHDDHVARTRTLEPRAPHLEADRDTIRSDGQDATEVTLFDASLEDGDQVALRVNDVEHAIRAENGRATLLVTKETKGRIDVDVDDWGLGITLVAAANAEPQARFRSDLPTVAAQPEEVEARLDRMSAGARRGGLGVVSVVVEPLHVMAGLDGDEDLEGAIDPVTLKVLRGMRQLLKTLMAEANQEVSDLTAVIKDAADLMFDDLNERRARPPAAERRNQR